MPQSRTKNLASEVLGWRATGASEYKFLVGWRDRKNIEFGKEMSAKMSEAVGIDWGSFQDTQG